MKKKSLFSIGLIFCILALISTPVWAEPDFRIAIKDYDYFVKEDAHVTVSVDITNFGEADIMKVELGIYKKTTLEEWGIPFAMTSDIKNCESYQTNVDTRSISLARGESITELFRVQVPEVPWGGLLNEDNGHEFMIHTTTFINCYNTGLTVGQSSYDTAKIVIVPDVWEFSHEENCADGIKNNDETDTDCGGPNCKRCPNNYKCNVKTDCLSGYCVGTCEDVPDIDGDGKADYDEADSQTPWKIKLNELTQPITQAVKDFFESSKIVYSLAILGILLYILMFRINYSLPLRVPSKGYKK